MSRNGILQLDNSPQILAEMFEAEKRYGVANHHERAAYLRLREFVNYRDERAAIMTAPGRALGASLPVHLPWLPGTKGWLRELRLLAEEEPSAEWMKEYVQLDEKSDKIGQQIRAAEDELRRVGRLNSSLRKAEVVLVAISHRWLFAALVVMPAVQTAAVAVGWVCRKRRFAAGSCTGCGYSLRGNVSGDCPECGRRVCADQAQSVTNAGC